MQCLRRLVIGIATTIPLLGLPWVVGLLLRVIPNTDITFIVANYIFIIVNASQVCLLLLLLLLLLCCYLLMYLFLGTYILCSSCDQKSRGELKFIIT